MTSVMRSRRAKASVATLTAALGLASVLAGSHAANADPKQFSAMVTTGSDTTQDVLNAYAGAGNNGTLFTPVQSSAASGYRQVVSFDAVGSDCITPKAPGATFLRPNGSTNGRRALSRAIDGANWPASTSLCGGPKPVSGLVDFARSSAGPSGTGTDLTYIPFGRDALSFGYYANGVAPVTTLTSAQLNSLFTTGPQVIGGVEIVPCGIQTGSGTYQFWNTALGMTASQESAGTATCNNAANAAGLNTSLGGRSQENDAQGLKARGDLAAFAGKQVIIGFSAANFISQSNGFAASQLAAGVNLGGIDALGVPYTGTAPNTSPNPTFYSSTTYGRDVYNVVPSFRFNAPAAANADFKSMFQGPNSAICTADAITEAFGFQAIANCGDTTLKGPLVA